MGANNPCAFYSRELEALQANLLQREGRIERLERTIQSLSDEIENDRDSFDNDDIHDAVEVAIALASIIPAVRAVRLGIGALRAGISVVQAIRNGQSLSEAILTVLGGMSAINLLSTPSPRRKIENLLSAMDEEMGNVEQINKSINIMLENMHRSGCTLIN